MSDAARRGHGRLEQAQPRRPRRDRSEFHRHEKSVQRHQPKHRRSFQNVGMRTVVLPAVGWADRLSNRAGRAARPGPTRSLFLIFVKQDHSISPLGDSIAGRSGCGVRPGRPLIHLRVARIVGGHFCRRRRGAGPGAARDNVCSVAIFWSASFNQHFQFTGARVHLRADLAGPARPSPPEHSASALHRPLLGQAGECGGLRSGSRLRNIGRTTPEDCDRSSRRAASGWFDRAFGPEAVGK